MFALDLSHLRIIRGIPTFPPELVKVSDIIVPPKKDAAPKPKAAPKRAKDTTAGLSRDMDAVSLKFWTVEARYSPKKTGGFSWFIWRGIQGFGWYYRLFFKRELNRYNPITPIGGIGLISKWYALQYERKKHHFHTLTVFPGNRDIPRRFVGPTCLDRIAISFKIVF